jgi:hypothetical protein
LNAHGPAQAEARGTLLVLLAIVIVLQPVAIALGRQALAAVGAGADTYGLWSNYQALPAAPDVLFIGDSRVRADIDTARVAELLSKPENAVFKLGISNGQPSFLSALIERVLERTTRPRTIIYGLSEFQFNDRWIWDATADYWAVSEPVSPGHVQRSLVRATDPGRLVRGWVVPALANDRVLWLGANCWWERLRTPDACTEPSRLATHVMTDADQAAILANYRRDLSDYRHSSIQEKYLVELISAAQAKGVSVALMIPPVWGIDELFPGLYDRYLARMSMIAERHGVVLLDLHTAIRNEPTSWADPSHLNVVGARALAPMLLPLVTGGGILPSRP